MKPIVTVVLALACIPTNVNAEATDFVCRVKSPKDDSPSIFELKIDQQERRVVECFRSVSGIVVQEFSEISIAAECPISEGGKRTFRLTRDTGAITVSEVLTKPIVSRRTLTGECKVGQIRPSTPPSARIETPKDDQPRAQQLETRPPDLPTPRSMLGRADVAHIINEQFGRICRAKIEGFFSSTLRLDWTSETKIIHVAAVMAAIGKSKETIYEKGIRYLKFPNNAGGYNVIDWKTGDKSSINESAPYYFPN